MDPAGRAAGHLNERPVAFGCLRNDGRTRLEDREDTLVGRRAGAQVDPLGADQPRVSRLEDLFGLVEHTFRDAASAIDEEERGTETRFGDLSFRLLARDGKVSLFAPARYQPRVGLAVFKECRGQCRRLSAVGSSRSK